MSLSFTAPMGMDVDLIYSNFDTLFQDVISKLDFFIDEVKKSDLFVNETIVQHQINAIDSRKHYLLANCEKLFKENKSYLLYQIVGRNFISYLEEVLISISSLDDLIFSVDVNKVYSTFQELVQAFNTISNIVKNEKAANQLIEDLEAQVEKATESVKSVISAKEALESKPTEDIYSSAAKKYIKTARFYDVLLLVLLGFFYYLTSQFFENFQMISIFKAIQKSSSEAQTLAIFFFITKLTIVSIVITLATIFIRRSSHFRKLHDQANQTSLELNALPNYLRQVDSEHHSEIYREMIPKFFGKELDQSQNDKVGDLVKDQLAASTELLKASAEMVKNAKSLGGSVDITKNAKSYSTSTEDKSKSDNEV